MSLPHLLMWTIALVVGVPAAWRNPTAGALVLAWAASEAGLPPSFYIYPDIFTIMIVFAKPRYRPCPAYWDLSVWGQLKCIWTERSPADRFILLSLPVAWCFYSLELSYPQYWALWWIAVCQFFAAASEPLFNLVRRRSPVSAQPHVRNGLEATVG